MMKIVSMVVAFFVTTVAASAGTLIVNGEEVPVDFTKLCHLAKSGQTTVSLAGALVRLGISADSHLVVGEVVLQKSCKGKKPTHSAGGSGDTPIAADTTPVTNTPPVDGDGAGIPAPTPKPAEAPKPAGDGGPATQNGNERPPQGGDVDGYEADNSPVTDAPAPTGG